MSKEKEQNTSQKSDKVSLIQRAQTLLASREYKKFMAQLYGWGAAVVILGALFKINHFPGANFMLILGMGTEAIIFAFSSFEPLHQEYHWENLYPELVGDEESDGTATRSKAGGRATNVQEIVIQRLEELFLQANITPEIFNRLEKGLQGLVETTTNVNNVTNVLVANNEYVAEVAKMTTAVEKTTESIAQLEQLYVSQMAFVNTQAAVTNKLQESMTQVLETLGASLEDAKKYKNDIADLSVKVAKLNDIYGKMMSAITSAVQN
ncbi:MAG: gliding motility protein GldL [Bacteroidales bacterium]|jgi:gliding motility-associated protein GldL|nr:gliding motility protein GldL [Bacteroidales bacterium]